MVKTLRFWLYITLLTSSYFTHAATDIAITIDPANIADPSIPDIAAPVDFSAYLIDESTVELSWNPVLLDGSAVEYFNIWNNHSVIASTTEGQWRVGVNRDYAYDFAISAVTDLGEETRRSSRIYYDLPQLDASLPDGYNQYLPPLENLKAEVVSEDSVELTWDAAPAYWSWADPSEYTYAVIVNGSYIDVVDEPRYTFTGLADRGEVWIGVESKVSNILQSRQPQRVLVDTSNPVGTFSTGVTGFNSISGFHTEVYSSTAAELFWDIDGQAVSHIYINGRLVARINEGKSLFIENLPPGERVLVSVGEGWPYDEGQQYSYMLAYDYPLMHAWIEMPDGFPIEHESTPAVTGLRAEVYSSSAAEVFWDRADEVLTRYRVYINDEFLIETDAVSWFFDNLPADSQTTVGIVAVEPAGPDGRRSGFLIETSFRTFQEYGNPLVNCYVEGLHSTVYSSTAAEVFWDRDATGPQYELFLNGEFLIDTDATSWFFKGLEPGSVQSVSVKVVNAGCDGNEASVQFEMVR